MEFQIGDRSFTMPVRSLDQLHAIREGGRSYASLDAPRLLDLYVRDVHATLAPAYPDLAPAWLEENLDVPTAVAILHALAAQMAVARPRGQA